MSTKTNKRETGFKRSRNSIESGSKRDQRSPNKKFASEKNSKPYAKKPYQNNKNNNNNNNNNKYQSKAAPSTPAESRKIQQQKREYRKSLRTHHDLVTQAKTYWERIRDTVNVTAEERKKLINELLSIIKGSLMDLIRKHDGSRIIQTCVKYGNVEQRKIIISELEGHFLELAEKKYSRFLVNRIIDSASKPQRDIIFKEFYGKVMSMIKHKDACEVIEKAYSNATNFQKTLFVEEFYGNEFALFKPEKKRNLADIINENPEKKDQIMNHITSIINILLSKGLIYLSISHHVINEYYDNASPEQIREMTSLLAPELVHTVRTKYGAQIACKCVGYATAKERKIIIKAFKGNAVAVCQEPHGHMVIVKLLSVTDDTVLLCKSIVREMLDGLEHLLNDGNGRLPFLQILVPQSNLTRYFAPNSMELLQPNEILGPNNTLIPSSKKEPEVRRNELLSEIGKPVLQYCSSHIGELIRDKFGFAIIVESLLHAEGDKLSVINEIISLVEEDPNETEDHIMSHPIASRVVKTLIASDFSVQNDDGSVVFSELVFDATKNNLVKWATTDYSSAIITALLRSETTGEKVKAILKKKEKELKKHAKTRGTKAIITDIF